MAIAFSLSACNKKEKQQKKGNDKAVSDVEDKEKTSDNNDKDDDIIVLKDQWPKDKLPEVMPELTEGKIVNWGDSNGEVIIKMEDVPMEAVEEYKEKLISNGWRVTDNGTLGISATYELFGLSIDYSDNGSVQLWLTESKEVGWSTELLPSDFPKFEDGKVVDACKDDELNLVYISIEGGTVEEALKYGNLLKEKGWEGDEPVLEDGQDKFHIQLSKGDMFMDLDYYDFADGFTVQISK